MEISITKLSSKGQIVIPTEMRKNMKEGEKLLVIKNGSQLILKKADKLEKDLHDDLTFAKRTEAALEKHKKGQFKSKSFDDFIQDLEQC